MVLQKKLPGSVNMPNGNNRANREQANMSFSNKDVSGVRGSASKQQNGFRTDSAISGNRFGGERPLQRWVPDEDVPVDMSLESGRNQSGTWDQFAVNERLFGLKTDYDENIYTTTIDRSHPDYQKRLAEADRKAREIENSDSVNRHVLEERIRDHLTIDDSGLDEEDKYSGVQRGNNDFPPLGSTGRSDKYTPPARRAPSGTATVRGVPVDPAIISAQLARPEKPVINVQSMEIPPHNPKKDVASPPTTTESSFVPTPETKNTGANNSSAASRNVSPATKPGAPQNATDTVERDVVTAFKGFADQQRKQHDKLRLNKAKQDKEVKLQELKAFASSFKLNSAIPKDLVAIIAKDPAKQRAIQENAQRQAEEAAKEKARQELAAKAAAQVTRAPETKPAQRIVPITAPAAAPAQPARQTPNRNGNSNGPQQQRSYHNNQSFRNDAAGRMQMANMMTPPGGRMRSADNAVHGGGYQPYNQFAAGRPPTGPAGAPDMSASRRTSANAAMSAKLNPNSHEFRPNAAAASFISTREPSNASSTRSTSVVATPGLLPTATGTFLRRKPGQPAKKKAGPVVDIIERMSKETPPEGRNWNNSGGLRPAFDTPPTWRQMKPENPDGTSGEPPNSTMLLTYPKLFENARFAPQPLSPSQQSILHPQMPPQLPMHLQHGSARPSPRQPPLHMYNGQHQGHPFNPNDDHRMMPSQSASSFASPRLHQVGVAYQSPMGQPTQMNFQQPGVPYPMGPMAPQMAAQFRSYSGGHQFMPQQPSHMGGPVMVPGGAYIGGPGMMPGQPVPYLVAQQPPFVQQGGGPPSSIAGSSGYPSPGRTAPIMTPSGSHQGQPAYGMSPIVPYGQPIYGQHMPQVPNMRVYPPQGNQFGQQFGTSPQMHQHNGQYNRGPNGNYARHNNHHNGPQHQQQQPPAGPPPGAEAAEAK